MEPQYQVNQIEQPKKSSKLKWVAGIVGALVLFGSYGSWLNNKIADTKIESPAVQGVAAEVKSPPTSEPSIEPTPTSTSTETPAPSYPAKSLVKPQEIKEAPKPSVAPVQQKTTTTTTSTGGDKDCSDFKSHEEAQAYFVSKGGSPSNNVDRLDRDRDGLACEDQ